MEIQLSQKLLRLRYDWVDGIWKQSSQSTTPESNPRPHRAASVVGLSDPAPSLTKKRKFPKVRASKENKHCKPSSKEIYPDHLENRPLRDSPHPDDQATSATQPEPAPAQRRKGVLKLSLPMCYGSGTS
ncbi:unnamed protein product [Urochloa humidicola]